MAAFSRDRPFQLSDGTFYKASPGSDGVALHLPSFSSETIVSPVMGSSFHPVDHQGPLGPRTWGPGGSSRSARVERPGAAFPRRRLVRAKILRSLCYLFSHSGGVFHGHVEGQGEHETYPPSHHPLRPWAGGRPHPGPQEVALPLRGDGLFRAWPQRPCPAMTKAVMVLMLKVLHRSPRTAGVHQRSHSALCNRRRTASPVQLSPSTAPSASGP